MSADNGIYILKTKDGQYRVIHTQAIDNLWWSHIKGELNNQPVSTRIVEYFGEVNPFYNLEKARDIAFNMVKRYVPLEHGVNEIEIDKTWYDILEEAKSLAKKEIEYLQEDQTEFCDGFWQEEIDILKQIFDLT